MGMDVYGKAPRSKAGEYFLASVWSWRPIAILCQEVAPRICEPCKGWHYNDGDGLDDEHSQRLAKVLQHLIDSGKLAVLLAVRRAALDAMPDEERPGPGGVMTKMRPYETWYVLELDHFQEWVNFLKDCGGFEIR